MGVGRNAFEVKPASLLEWYGASGRHGLPWRQTRDPWAVLVAELMLQQTQVARVIPKYEAFLDRFPSVADCAAGLTADVVTLWAGLGYNRRAVNLHRCAVAVVGEHHGRFPQDLAALLALPGVGPYTARAVLAFAFEADVAVVDTNVARILARRGNQQLTTKQAQSGADGLVPVGHGWAWNQAMLDLGATVCTKRHALCGNCPVSVGCRWSEGGRPDPDPAVGSAGVSGRQSTFEGSDRQGRGRLVDALRQGPVEVAQLPTAMGWPDDAERATRVAATLLADGLAATDGNHYRLA